MVAVSVALSSKARLAIKSCPVIMILQDVDDPALRGLFARACENLQDKDRLSVCLGDLGPR